MKEDTELFKRENHKFCQAVEDDGAICFNPIHAKSYCTKHYQRLRLTGSINIHKKIIKKCKFIDCNGLLFSKGYCKKHYYKYVYIPKNKSKKCKVKNCENYRNGLDTYCAKHRTRLAKHGTLIGSGKARGNDGSNLLNARHRKRRIHFECIVPGCNNNFQNSQHFAKGLCNKHYQRWRRFGDYNISSYKEFLLSKQKDKT